MPAKRRFIASLILGLLSLFIGKPVLATTCVMNAWSGSDGPFNIVSMDGNSIVQGADTGGGNYSGFVYYRRPAGVNFSPGAALYMEVDFKDLGGPGRIGAQYNEVSADFQSAGFVLAAWVENSGAYKTAVIRLDNADFRLAQNGGNDLRLTRSGNLRFHIKEVRVSDAPTPLYLSLTAFLGPYTGPTYAGGTAVDSSTMLGKVLCGYQGWFRTPADDDGMGWIHWTKSWGSLSPALISEDFWPEMTEFTAAERHDAPGFTYPGGAQATLFSSDNARTVLRHFQWMEAWGIDGVAAQRFTNGLASPGIDSIRVLSHIRAAANQTGRTYFVEYDMTGTPEAQLVSNIQNDWHYLKDTLQITSDPAYLHHGGKPVVGVFGFFADRFSAATANAILDIFEAAGYEAFFAGAGAWYWRTDAANTPAWTAMLYRMDSWQPWNMGNYLGPGPYRAKTDYWAADKADFESRGIIYVPEIYPGGSSYNRDALPPGTGVIPRRGGDFLWKQFYDAKNIGAQTAFVGMFDELDEGTQILKVTSSPPTQATFADYEGQASDCYLCYTSLGTKMLRGEIPLSATKPDCAALTQPTIPDPAAPLNSASVAGPSVNYSWTAALALAGGGSLSRYEIWLDGTVVSAGLVTNATISTGAGSHIWRVRAVNSLGNAGGWSVAQSFSVTGPGFSPTRTFTPAPSSTSTSSVPTATPSPTPSSSPTKTPVPASGCSLQAEDYVAYNDATAGNAGGQYRFDDVDIENTSDAGGGYNVGFTDNGEWLEYLVNVSAAGNYDITLRTASNNAGGGSAQLSLDGAILSPVIALPATGGWQAFTNTSSTNLALPSGVHRLRLTILTGGSNYNYLCFAPASTPTPSATLSRSPTRSATPSLTLTSTRSYSPTQSLTYTATCSFTPSQQTTPTPSFTISSTPTPSPSASITPTQSLTWTATPSFTPTQPYSPTPTATASPSATITGSPPPSGTPSASFTPSATFTASATLTRSMTATPSLGPGLPSPSPTPTSSPTSAAPPPGPTFVGADAPTELEAGLVSPNPASGPSFWLAFKLKGRAENLDLKLYGSALTQSGQRRLVGNWGPGWNKAGFDSQDLANGLYYYNLTLSGSQGSDSFIGKFVVLR